MKEDTEKLVQAANDLKEMIEKSESIAFDFTREEDRRKSRKS